MKNKTEQFISWASVNNWIPLIAIIISTMVTFGTFSTRLALMEQNQEQLTATQIEIKEAQKEILALLREDQVSNQQLGLKINTLEAILGLKK